MKEKLSYYFKILGTILREPSSLYRVLDAPLEDPKYGKSYLQEKFGRSELPSIDILDVIPDLNECLRFYSYLPGTSMTVDIAFLMALARSKKNCKYLEIGSWRGESIANVAQVASECYSVTLGPNDMLNAEFSIEQIKLHGFYSKGLNNLKEVFANSLIYNFNELETKFDVIFIDGDHKQSSIASDTAKAFQLLTNDDAVIVWHDYGWDTERVRYNTLAGILEGCPPEKHSSLYHVGQTKCAIYWPKPIETFTNKRFSIPRTNFKVSIQAEKL